jgi:hypothetical protein
METQWPSGRLGIGHTKELVRVPVGSVAAGICAILDGCHRCVGAVDC